MTRVEHPFDLLRHSPINRLFDDWSNLLDRWFDRSPAYDFFGSDLGLHIEESEKELIVELDAPGFDAGDFDVQISDNVLKVVAETKAEAKSGARERRLHRQLTLPAEVQADKVEARYENGVLELRFQKSERAQWKRVEVKKG